MKTKRLSDQSFAMHELFKNIPRRGFFSEWYVESLANFLIDIKYNTSQKEIFKSNLTEFIKTPLFCITCRKLSKSRFVESFDILKNLGIPENIFNFMIFDEDYLNVFFESVLESCGETINKNCILEIVEINLSEEEISNYFDQYINFLGGEENINETIFYDSLKKKFFKKLLTSDFYNFENTEQKKFFDFYIRIFDNNLNSLVNMALSKDCTTNKPKSMRLIIFILNNIDFYSEYEGTIKADIMELIFSKYQYIDEIITSESSFKKFFALKYNIDPFEDLGNIPEENRYSYLQDFKANYCYKFSTKLKKLFVTLILTYVNYSKHIFYYMIPFESFIEMVKNDEIDLNILPLEYIIKVIGDDFKKFSEMLNYPEFKDRIKMFKFDDFKHYPNILGFLFISSKIEDEFLLNFAFIDLDETDHYQSEKNEAFKLEFPNLIKCKRFIKILKKICKTQEKNQIQRFLEDFTNAPAYLFPIIDEILDS